ncbi:MAG: hypothetical protein ABTQ31_07330 [Rhizobiaceae bacterium]
MIRDIEKFENAARMAMGSYDAAAAVPMATPASATNIPWLAVLAALAGAALFLSVLL